MFFVYILRSLSYADKYYTGFTTNLEDRLNRHNNGEVASTTNFIPWEIKNYFAFETKNKALAFEKYLKSHSGRAFAKKHF